MNTIASRGREHCLFVRGGSTFALSTEVAREIAGPRPVTPLPHAPQALLGALNLHGEILGLVSLDRALGFEGRGDGRETIVLCRRELKFAVEVDRTTGIRPLLDEHICALPQARAIRRELVRGEATIDGSPVVVLDEDALLRWILESMAAGVHPPPPLQPTGSARDRIFP